MLKKRFQNFCPNLILTIDIKRFLFSDSLLAKSSNLGNIKLELLQSTFLKWYHELYRNIKILKI